MAIHFKSTARFPQEGIEIQEIVGALALGNNDISIARIKCEPNWSEAAQTPEFDEYCFVISGVLCVRTGEQIHCVAEGEAIMTPKGERIQYFTGPEDGADYLSICLPAFLIEKTHRED